MNCGKLRKRVAIAVFETTLIALSESCMVVIIGLFRKLPAALTVLSREF